MSTEETIKSPQTEQNQNTEQLTQEESNAQQKEYEQRAQFFIEEFDQKITQENVPIAVAILIDPKLKQPIIYSKGGTYQLAKISADLTRHFKTQLAKELSV